MRVKSWAKLGGVATVVVLAAPLAIATPAHAATAVSLDYAGNPNHLGDAVDHGDLALSPLNSPVVAMSAALDGGGYWLLGGDGGVFSYGSAQFFGSTGSLKLNKPVVGMAPTPSGNGYRFVASDGGIFAYGDAGFYGSAGSIKLNQPIVGMAPTPSGNGYWLVASDGGIFAYGDAAFYGSAGSIKLNKPIVGMSATPSGRGYWLVASDGGIFAYGDAAFYGSTGAINLNKPIVSMSSTKDGNGYWLAASDGGVFAYGDAKFYGSGGAHGVIVGMTRTVSGNGYWFVSAAGAVLSDSYPTVHYPAPGESVSEANNYAFEYEGGGGPARWDSCIGAVHYTISSDDLPTGGVALVQGAMRELASITGLQFVYDGLTSSQVSLYQSHNNGFEIGWLKPADYEGVSGSDGYTYLSWYNTNRGGRNAWANVELLDTAGTSWYNNSQSFNYNYMLVVKHELGHAMGLDHSPSVGQVMYASADPSITDYQSGDLQGLADVSTSAGCVS